ncbi:MAG: hypothetical protein AABY07_01555 [Nanoarchaeota archaeon]
MKQPKFTEEELKKKIEKLDLAMLRKEMYPPTPQILDGKFIDEIVAREINLIEDKLNQIIERLNEET